MSILNKVVDLMREASQMKNLNTGQLKKKFVLDAVRSILEYPDPVEDLICEFIDIIIAVDKGKLVINPIIKKSIFSCYNACNGKKETTKRN